MGTIPRNLHICEALDQCVLFLCGCVHCRRLDMRYHSNLYHLGRSTFPKEQDLCRIDYGSWGSVSNALLIFVQRNANLTLHV